MNTVILVLGSNTADRERAIESALEFLRGEGEMAEHSSIYESPDMLGKGNRYLNSVTRLRTYRDMTRLHSSIKDYEHRCGRTSSMKERGEVPIDIDIVVWNGKVVRQSDFNASYFKKGFKEISGINC